MGYDLNAILTLKEKTYFLNMAAKEGWWLWFYHDPKTVAVQSFKALNFKVVAAGDSYNDVGMLQAANRGYFFDAPEKVTIDYPEIPTIVGYNELLTALDEYLDEMKAQNDSPAS